MNIIMHTGQWQGESTSQGLTISPTKAHTTLLMTLIFQPNLNLQGFDMCEHSMLIS